MIDKLTSDLLPKTLFVLSNMRLSSEVEETTGGHPASSLPSRHSASPLHLASGGRHSPERQGSSPGAHSEESDPKWKREETKKPHQAGGATSQSKGTVGGRVIQYQRDY